MTKDLIWVRLGMYVDRKNLRMNSGPLGLGWILAFRFRMDSGPLGLG